MCACARKEREREKHPNKNDNTVTVQQHGIARFSTVSHRMAKSPRALRIHRNVRRDTITRVK